MTKRDFREGQAVLGFLMLLTVLAGWLRSVIWGSVDTPCFATYDPERDCIENAYSVDAERPVIEAYISVSELGWGGGGCRHAATPDSGVDIETLGGKAQIELRADGIAINGIVMQSDADYEMVNYMDPNPWVVARTKVTYVGLVANCNEGDRGTRHVVIGQTATAIGYEKGVAFIAILASGIWWLRRREKQLGGTV